MNQFQDILKKAQRILACPICKRSYRLNEIKIRGVFDHTYIFQTVCAKHINPVLTIFIANQEGRVSSELKLIKEIEKESSPINLEEVIDLHEALKDFNGDFRAVFRKE